MRARAKLAEGASLQRAQLFLVLGASLLLFLLALAALRQVRRPPLM